MEHKVYLSRRNLTALLSKLDRRRDGQTTACTLIKNDTVHENFPQTIAPIAVIAVEDEEYYTDRPAGETHPLDIKR